MDRSGRIALILVRPEISARADAAHGRDRVKQYMDLIGVFGGRRNRLTMPATECESCGAHRIASAFR
jgi:hypothetical protein